MLFGTCAVLAAEWRRANGGGLESGKPKERAGASAFRRTAGCSKLGIEVTIRAYASRVQVLNAQGEHLRRINGELAEYFVKVGTAEPEPGNGRIRAVQLVRIAAHNAAMMGPPSTLTA
jgi:hypothetical protein